MNQETKTVFWIVIIISSVVVYFSYITGYDSGNTDGLREGYSIAQDEQNEIEDELEESQNCVSLLREQLDDADSQISAVSSDLRFYLDGDYYDLYDSSDSAVDDLESINFFDPC